MTILGTVSSAGGASALCAQGTRVVERPLQPGDEISLNQVIRTMEGGVLAVQMPDGSRLEISGGREITLTERTMGRLAQATRELAGKAGNGAEAEKEQTDAEIEAIQEALLAGEDPSELEATAAGGGPTSEGGSSFVIIERNGQRTLVELDGLDTEAALRKLFGELDEDIILTLLEEAGIPVFSITMSEDDASGTSSRTTSDSVEFDGRGAFGTLSFDAETGAWTYTLSPEGQRALNLLGVNDAGEPDQVTEVFQFTLIDEDGNRTAAVITVTVNGVDDPLVISNFQPLDGDHHVVVDERDLPDGAVAEGSFDFSVPDGFGALELLGASLSIGDLQGANTTSIPLQTALGSTLRITGYDGDFTGGTVYYEYVLLADQDHDGEEELFESIPFTLVDDDGDRLDGLLVARILNDFPVEVTGGVVTVDEGDLRTGTHRDGGEGDAHDAGVSATGTVVLSAPDGFTSIKIGTSTVFLSELEGASEEEPVAVFGGNFGDLVITGYDGNAFGGTIFYRYTLTSAVTQVGAGENEETGDLYPIELVDADGSTGVGAIEVLVIDDVPVVGAVQHGLMAGMPGVLNGVIELEHSADGFLGPIGISPLSGMPESWTWTVATDEGFSTLTASRPSSGEGEEDTDIFTLTVYADGSYSFELIEERSNPLETVYIGDLSGNKPSPYTITTTEGTEADGGDLLANPITFTSASGSAINISGQGIGAGNNHINVSDTLTVSWQQPVAAATLTFSRIDNYKDMGKVTGREAVGFVVLLGGVAVASGTWVPHAVGDDVDFAFDPATALTNSAIQDYTVLSEGWDGASFDAIALTLVNDPDQQDATEAVDLVRITTPTLPDEDLELSFQLDFPVVDEDPLTTVLDIHVVAEGSTGTGYLLTGGEENEVILGSAGPDTIDGRGGSDSIDAGAGDDTILFDAADSIDGGDGYDTLLVDGVYEGGQVTHIEVFSMADGPADGTAGDRISLSVSEVLSVTGGGGTLRILGDANDEVSLDAASSWTVGDAGDDGFTPYMSGAVTVEVQAGIEVRLSDGSEFPAA